MTPEEMRSAAREFNAGTGLGPAENAALSICFSIFTVAAEICDRLDKLLAERENRDGDKDAERGETSGEN